MTASTPHPSWPKRADPPSPSRGEGEPVRVAGAERTPSTAPPSPLEGEGARRADEGFLAAIAERDQARGRTAGRDWRSPETKRLRGFAKSMRHEPTDAERALWSLLRSRRFVGHKFRRQVPIGSYIVDVMCLAANPIVELDGSQHAENDYDVVRDGWLRAQAYRVLRIWNNELTNNRNGVREAIWAALEGQGQ